MINAYTGPMFSGKSEYLINIYEKMYNKDIIIAFKPWNDSRDENYIKSKNSPTVIPAIYIEYLEEIDDYLNKFEKEGRKISTVFIDEAQFLKGDVSVLSDLSVYKNIDFYIAGLDMTSEQKPFGLMPFILAVANNIVKIKGYCVECNKESEFTYYDGEKDGDVLVGDGNYECLCRKCLEKKPVKIRKKVK